MKGMIQFAAMVSYANENRMYRAHRAVKEVVHNAYTRLTSDCTGQRRPVVH